MSETPASPRVCDAHCDTLYSLLTAPQKPTDVTLERLQQGGVAIQTMAMYVGPAAGLDVIEQRFEGMFDQLEALKQAGWRQVDDPKEVIDAQPHMLLSIEGCEVFARGLSVIADYRARGVRMAAITWNHPNALGTPHCVDATTGLSGYGLNAVREMQRLGIAVDVSHLNEAGFYDILKKTDVPPLASHSCARALRDHTRNLTDGQLRALFGAGGFVGLSFFPMFLTDGPVCTIDTVIDHIQHMYDQGGAGMVGFGSDFDGISTKPEGLDNPGDFPHLIEGLRRRGFDESDVLAIAGGAFIRYFERI